ncbi:Ff.00g066950.m01.CDS01 [Fusarium sp. VM40]|nr:Ff.00g066950.m01.CDS01 [Fusarium sp. VM40]
MAILPNLAHLGLVEDTDLHRRWNFDLSAPTLNALGITTLPLKTFENDYGMPKLLSRTKGLEMLITGGRGQVPEIPNLRALHIRALDGNYISTNNASPIFESSRHLTTFSFTATGTPLSKVIECLDQPRFHASLESIRLDLRCHRDLNAASQDILKLKMFTTLRKLFVPIAPIYSASDIELQPQSLVSILPPSIEYLTLMEHVTPTACGLLHTDLLRLIEKKPTLFPELREIMSDSVQVCDEGLKNVFWQAGVALIHRELPRSKWDYTGQLFYDCEYRPWDASREGCYMEMPLPCELSDEDL